MASRNSVFTAIFVAATLLGFQLARGQQPVMPPPAGVPVVPTLSSGNLVKSGPPTTAPTQQLPAAQSTTSTAATVGQVTSGQAASGNSATGAAVPAATSEPNTSATSAPAAPTSRQASPPPADRANSAPPPGLNTTGTPPPGYVPPQLPNPGPQGPIPQPQKAGGPNAAAPTPPAFVPSVVESIFPTAPKSSAPNVVIHTSMGAITIMLNPGDAPKTVENFLNLVHGEREFVDVATSKKTRRPFYNGLFFHRVAAGFLIQTGCPFGSGRGGPGYTIPDEINPNMKFNRPGLVAMAPQRDGTNLKPDTNGSQFFITLREMPEWDGKFTIFGEVTKGLGVAEKISRVKVGPTERPIRRVYINSIE